MRESETYSSSSNLRNTPSLTETRKNLGNKQYAKSNTPQGSSIRGFGVQASRFNSSASEIPGPGYYHDESKTDIEKKTPSLSKKGYSNGFTSAEYHRDDFLGPVARGDSPPSPGPYNIPRAMDYTQFKMNRKGFSGYFLKGTKNRVPFATTPALGPEPGDYDRPYDPLNGPKYIRNKPSAIFQTVGDRHSFMDTDGLRSDSPGPGTYINSDNKPDKASSDFAHHWSKTNLKRFSVIDEGTPGPTHYFQVYIYIYVYIYEYI
jgi:hypothetical protein